MKLLEVTLKGTYRKVSITPESIEDIFRLPDGSAEIMLKDSDMYYWTVQSVESVLQQLNAARVQP